MRKIIIFLSIVLFFGINSCLAEEDEFTITTYYPSPYGVYKELKLYPNTSPNDCNANNEGVMYYDNNSNQVKLCKESPPFTYSWVSLGRVPQGPDTETTRVTTFHNVAAYGINSSSTPVHCGDGDGGWYPLFYTTTYNDASFKQYCKERGQTYVASSGAFSSNAGAQCTWDGSKWAVVTVPVGESEIPAIAPIWVGVIWCE